MFMFRLLTIILFIALLIHLYEWFMPPHPPPDNIARDTIIIGGLLLASFLPYTRKES